MHRAARIVRRRVPAAAASLAAQVAAATVRLRGLDVQKPPGIAEAIDWVAALSLLGLAELTPTAARQTLGSVLKYRDDQELAAERGVEWLVGAARA